MTIETKYNIGDEVWFMDGKRKKKGVIYCVFAFGSFFFYQVQWNDTLYPVFEKYLFPTKEELLKSL